MLRRLPWLPTSVPRHALNVAALHLRRPRMLRRALLVCPHHLLPRPLLRNRNAPQIPRLQPNRSAPRIPDLLLQGHSGLRILLVKPRSRKASTSHRRLVVLRPQYERNACGLRYQRVNKSFCRGLRPIHVLNFSFSYDPCDFISIPSVLGFKFFEISFSRSRVLETHGRISPPNSK